MSTSLLFDDQSSEYGAGDHMGLESSLQRLYAGLTSADTIRQYQKRNNQEEVAESLSWGERLRAGYTGLAHGLSSYGPEQLYRAMKTTGKIFGSQDLQDFASEGIARELRIRELDPFYKVPEGWHQDGWGRSLYEGMRGISSSAYAMLPGAAISLIPGGQVVGLASLGVGAGSVAGLAEYDSFMDEAVEKFQSINPELTRKEIEDDQFWNAFWSGFAEGGIEAATDIVGGKLIGLVGKTGLQPARRVLDQLVRNVTKTVTLEAGSEVATAVIQDYIRGEAGLDYQGRVNAFKNALGPALVGGAAFGVGGTALKLAQGKIQAEVNGNIKADLDAKAAELRRQYREAHYTPQAVGVFDTLTEGGSDYVQASTLMEAVESTAQAWADRTGNKVADWQGDGNKVVDVLKRLDDHRVNPEAGPAEALSSLRDIAMSELSVDQQQTLADTYGMETTTDGQADTVTLNSDRLDADLRRILADPKDTADIPDVVRPALESMRDSVMDMYGLANRHGLAAGIDMELSSTIGKAIEYRNANRPKAPAFIVQDIDLDTVVRKYGDFSKLSHDQQTAMIKDMAKTTQINFDKWDMPTDQKAMLGFIDTEMKPILDKVMHRGKRSDAKQEAMAKAALEADGINLERFAEFTAQLTGSGDLKESAAVKARELQIVDRLFLAKVTELAAVAKETMAPADIVKWHMAGALQQQVHTMLRAVRSESSHLLRAFNFIRGCTR